MTAPSAWRPLSEAPRIFAARYTVRANGHETEVEYNTIGWRTGNGKYLDETKCEYRAEVELDRAIQSEIARAFGTLIGGVKSAARPSNQYAEVDAHHAIIRAREILHTALGGRIPDHVDAQE